ncbi:MAG TPA: flagellar motor protein MotB [Azospirillaceae bacterium]|nr:flagellar motor protein MotB [Azospirillaceae bacterium]
MASNAGGGKNQAPIIIKKIVKGGEGHHGGAWKVAYADFVTAMMAFFLLLWLLNVTTSEQKLGIADYFSPASPSKQESGAGGVLGGQTITVDGALNNQSSPPQLTVPVPSLPAAANAAEQVDDFKYSARGRPDGTKDKLGNTDQENAGGPSMGDQKGGLTSAELSGGIADLDRLGGKTEVDANGDGEVDAQELQEALAEYEAQQFQEAAEELRQAIQQVPELKDLAQNLIVDQTPEGLRIQIVDQEGYSMFPAGSAKMFPQTSQLMALVAQAVSKLPNKLSVSGHTDGIPFSGANPSYGNWELSTERANASRRALVASGIDEARFLTVVGKADRDHLFPGEPNSPRNRRVSIVLLREQPLGGLDGQAPADGGAAAPGR